MAKDFADNIPDPDRHAEIGGYFGFDLPDYGDPFADHVKFQSARAGLRAILESCGAKCVQIPAYICSSMINSANDAGAEVEIYHLDQKLYPLKVEREWHKGLFFVYVNYFGLAEETIRRLTKEIPPERLIIDNSQALFASFDGVLASVYSPRKFAGLPDGGLVWSSGSEIPLPVAEDRGSIERMRHLVTRLAYSAREGYAEFNAARLSLADNTPLRMSRLTRRLLRTIPWEKVRKARRDNYRRMDERLGGYNFFPLRSIGNDAVPLCYPLWLKGNDLRTAKAELAKEDIFTPTYWEDALPRTGRDCIEGALIREALFLPIDQRMDYRQVDYVCERVLRLID